jgi:hypothetical protein
VTHRDFIFRLVSAKVKRATSLPVQVRNKYALLLSTGLGVQSCLIRYWNGISLGCESSHDLYEADNLEVLYLQ